MAYSDYGAFVYLNGKRRNDKEDVGVYDTDEAQLPQGMRVWANILKNIDSGEDKWWEHSHHGVMGDGYVRVGCYKQGWPELYIWEDGKDEPTAITYDCLSRKFGWEDFDEYRGIRCAPYTYHKEFDFHGWHFTFDGNEFGGTPKYSAEMERDGEHWECDYDYGFGAGLSDF